MPSLEPVNRIKNDAIINYPSTVIFLYHNTSISAIYIIIKAWDKSSLVISSDSSLVTKFHFSLAGIIVL